MGRLLLWGTLALTPASLVAYYAFGVHGTPSFALSALALCPLAFLIGEATENVPELIISLFAVGSGLPNVVRGSLTGSIVSTALLVLGGAMVAGGDGALDRRSLLLQIATVLVAVLLFLVPSVPGWHGNPERHGLYVDTVPVAAIVLVLYVLMAVYNLRRHASGHDEEPADDAWSLMRGVAVLAAATAATAFVSEVLVHSLDAFGHSIGLSEFFVAAVIVALVGNAAEQGGAVLIARRGNPRLGAEIAVSSSTQVAVFVTPAIALLSFLVGNDLALD